MMVSQRASQDCFCQKYFNLLAENAKLKEEVARLKAKLARQERTAKEQAFAARFPTSSTHTYALLSTLQEACTSANFRSSAQDTAL